MYVTSTARTLGWLTQRKQTPLITVISYTCVPLTAGFGLHRAEKGGLKPPEHNLHLRIKPQKPQSHVPQTNNDVKPALCESVLLCYYLIIMESSAYTMCTRSKMASFLIRSAL